MRDLPIYDDVIAAVARVAGHASRTPVMSSYIPDEELGTEVLFKYEDLQRMGVFRLCGVFSALLRLSAEQRIAGVMAFPSGNHAQTIAFSARLLGIPTTIAMLADISAVKTEATHGHGEQVVLYDCYTESREQIGYDLAQRHGLTLILFYGHPDVLAGQGATVKKLPGEVGPLDALFTPLNGDGLLSGCALTIRAPTPACWVYGMEPEAGNDGQRSLRSGVIVHIGTPQTLTDGAQTQHLGNLTFPLIQRNADGILTASDAELADGMRFLAAWMKLLVEPIGCPGPTTAHQRKDELHGERVGIPPNGGNADLVCFRALPGSQPAAGGRIPRWLPSVLLDGSTAGSYRAACVCFPPL